MRKIELSACRPYREDRRQSGDLVRFAPILLAAVALVLFSAPAGAAMVKALQGQVLVNSGQGYRLVDGSTQLGPGATVVANPGAVAQVVYAGGCTVTVQAGSVYVIAPRTPCRTGQPTETGGLPDTGGPSEANGTRWAIGAAAIAAGGAAAFFLLKPSSP